MARHDKATIDVEIDGEEYELNPTLHAINKVERRFGSVTEAMEKMRNPSLDDVTLVICAGASITGAKKIEAVKEQVFNEGIMNVNPKAVELLISLLNPSGEERTESGDSGEESGKG